MLANKHYNEITLYLVINVALNKALMHSVNKLFISLNRNKINA